MGLEQMRIFGQDTHLLLQIDRDVDAAIGVVAGAGAEV
jgi:hypothetical protein